MAPTSFLQVSIGRCENPNVNLASPLLANPLELAFLEHAQQFALQGERDLADFRPRTACTPAANSNRPVRSFTAPVNAPRT